MHNIRPPGQMWPAEAFYLARKVQNFIRSACLLDKNTLWIGIKYRFWPLYPICPPIFLARLRFVLWTPGLERKKTRDVHFQTLFNSRQKNRGVKNARPTLRSKKILVNPSRLMWREKCSWFIEATLINTWTWEKVFKIL